MKELNMMEMENVNGGVDGGKVFGISWLSGMGAAGIAAAVVCGMTGPIGWGALAVVAGAGAAAAAVGGGITAAVTAKD